MTLATLSSSKSKCVICRGEYKKNVANQKYCSDNCRKIAHNEQARKYEAKKSNTCKDCGKKIFRLSKRCERCANLGRNNPRWIGGKIKTNYGYIYVYEPKHPFSNSSGYVLEHRIIVEKNIGRYLDPKEVVHHKNKIRDDNRIENLEICNGHAEHMEKHRNIKTGRFE